jgi:hypothetical protein
MSTYEKSDTKQSRALDTVMRKHHPRLVAAGVRVAMLVAHGKRNEDGELVAPAIRHHGVPALGLCAILPTKYRVLGLGDALVTVDGDRWDDMGEPEQAALLDHELTHLELVMIQVDVVKMDDAQRPVLRIRPHDHTFGWFDGVAQRHGSASQEVQQAKQFADDVGQLYLWKPEPRDTKRKHRDAAAEVLQ